MQTCLENDDCLGITTKTSGDNEVGWCMKRLERDNYAFTPGALGEKLYVRKNQLEGLWTEEKRNTNPEINNFAPCVSGEGFGCPDIMSNNYLPVRTGDLHGGDIGQCGRPGATLYDLQEECFNNPDCIAVTTTEVDHHGA